jgi:hypothetical protein
VEESFYIFLAGKINEKVIKSLSIPALPLGGGFMIARMSTEDVEHALRWPMERLESWSSPLLPYSDVANENVEAGFYMFLAGTINKNLFEALSIHAMPLENGRFMIARMSHSDVQRVRLCSMERVESWSEPLMAYDEMHSL